MRRVKQRVSCLRSFVARTKEGQEYLNREFESYADEKKRVNQENLY